MLKASSVEENGFFAFYAPAEAKTGTLLDKDQAPKEPKT
jgi:hypothetical protein